ncbi:MAG: DUF192 domain-containing protein [Nitrospirota bacterium]
MARLTRKTLWIVTAALVAVVVLLQFCPAARHQMNAYTLKTSSGSLTVDQFDSPERRLFVLGALTSFPPGRGVWFVFEDTERARLWSKNLQVEADVLWLDDTRQVVDRDVRVAPCADLDCPEYTPERFASSVLLLPPGTADDPSLAVGQTAFLQPVPVSPSR